MTVKSLAQNMNQFSVDAAFFAEALAPKEQTGVFFPIMTSTQLLSLTSFSAKLWLFHLKLPIISTSWKTLK